MEVILVAALARMRYPEQLLEELRREDPDTPITMHLIRRIAKSGLVKTFRVGSRTLINYDHFLEVVSDPEIANELEQPTTGIRKVARRQ